MTLPVTNYVNHCIEDLDILIRDAKLQRWAETTFCLQQFQSLLRQATRFIIPQSNQFLVDGVFPTRDEFEHLHLPYPILAIEYTVPSVKSNNTGFISKRIALAVSTENVSKYSELEYPITGDAGFIVFGAKCDEKIWVPSYSFGVVPENQLRANEQIKANKSILLKDTVIISEVHGFLPEVKNQVTKMLKENGKSELEIEEHVKQTMGYEIYSMLHFLSAFSCLNVVVEVQRASSQLNKKRIKSGKLPLLDYHYLRVKPGQHKINTQLSQMDDAAAAASHRKSPRFHTRRGHSRRIPSGRRVWVMPHVVGSIVNGVIVKDYLWL